jgi:hypothetical protein
MLIASSWISLEQASIAALTRDAVSTQEALSSCRRPMMPAKWVASILAK